MMSVKHDVFDCIDSDEMIMSEENFSETERKKNEWVVPPL